jgi:hypothetical protein
MLRFRKIHRKEFRQSHLSPRSLTLLIPSLHGNAIIRPSWVNRAQIIVAEKWTGPIGSARDQYYSANVVLQFFDRLGRLPPSVMRVGLQESRLTHYIYVVGFNNQGALATSAAAVAFKSCHRSSVSENLGGDKY